MKPTHSSAHSEFKTLRHVPAPPPPESLSLDFSTTDAKNRGALPTDFTAVVGVFTREQSGADRHSDGDLEPAALYEQIIFAVAFDPSFDVFPTLGRSNLTIIFFFFYNGLHVIRLYLYPHPHTIIYESIKITVKNVNFGTRRKLIHRRSRGRPRLVRRPV